jgi:hypothetical protein
MGKLRGDDDGPLAMRLAHAYLALADDDTLADQRTRPRIFAAAAAAVVLALGAPLGFLSLHLLRVAVPGPSAPTSLSGVSPPTVDHPVGALSSKSSLGLDDE